MAAILGKIFYPLVILLGVWCGKEDGVEVQLEIRGHQHERRVNVVCDKPDLRIPVMRTVRPGQE